MLFLMAHLCPLGISVMRSHRLAPFGPFFSGITCFAPQAGSRVRCPIRLGSMGLNALVKGSVIPANLPHRVANRESPFSEQISVFRRRFSVNAPGFRQGDKDDSTGFCGFGDLGSCVRFLQTHSFQFVHSGTAQQMVSHTLKNNARSVMLRAKDVATIFGFLDVVQVLGQADTGPGFDDSKHCPPPKKIAW